MTAPQVFLAPILNGDYQINIDGLPSVGGNVYTYANANNTLCNTYTTVDAITRNPQPIPVGSNGGLPNQIWIPQGQATDFYVYDTFDNLQATIYNVLGNGDPANFSSNANLAYFIANAALSVAQNATKVAESSVRNANNALIQANSSANTVQWSHNNVLVQADANTNFINTASINVAVTANGTHQVNIALNANLTYLGVNGESQNAANGYANVTTNVITQWGYVYGATFGAFPITVTFPINFTKGCWSVGVTMDGDGTAGHNTCVPRVYDPTITGFSIYLDTTAGETLTGGSNVFWQAWGS